MVRTHQLDIGMVGALTHAPGFIQYRVTSDRIVVIAPPNLDSNLTVREALAMPYITRDPGSGTRKAVEKALEQLSIPLSSLRIAAQAGSTEAVIALVSAGLGVSCVSDFAARAAAAQGRVSIIGELPSSRDFYLLLEEAKKDNPLIREFLRIHPAFSP
jgi:DNA-binding transcriptional LysR family regulator